MLREKDIASDQKVIEACAMEMPEVRPVRVRDWRLLRLKVSMKPDSTITKSARCIRMLMGR